MDDAMVLLIFVRLAKLCVLQLTYCTVVAINVVNEPTKQASAASIHPQNRGRGTQF
jgi:hypothetical protein